MSSTEDNKNSYCNVCLGDRKHTVLYSKNQNHEEYDPENGSPIYYENNNYILIECNGCENITLVIESDSNSYEGLNIQQYPPKITRKEPEWIFDLMLQDMFLDPYKYEFIREIYASLRNNNLRLAVIGIRSLLEQIMIEKVGDNRSFVKNLDVFQSEGYISRVQKEAITPVIEAGHASTHRGFKATANEVCHLMDIMENLIESIYINQDKLSKLNVPGRKT